MVNVRAKNAVALVNKRENHEPLEVWLPASLIIDNEETT
jgi:hypothetical protein